MVKINLSEMATFVRQQADTDTTDAPDSLLQVYARAAYNDIQGRVQPWPDKKVAYSFPSVADTYEYAMSSFSTTDMEFIVSVSTADRVLMYVSPERFRELRTESSNTSATPTVYTVDGSSIKLWPTPNSIATYYVAGYREFATWPSGSNEPDLPRGFDEPICWYMLSKYYMAQEDLELAGFYMREFDSSVNQQIERAMRSSAITAGPRIFGGDPRLRVGMGYEDWVKMSVEG